MQDILIKKEYLEIREKLWKGAFWSQSFCLMTAGGAPLESGKSRDESENLTVFDGAF